jgi:cell filamentation protein
MIGGAYDAFEDPYCYRRTSVLRNKGGLRKQEVLDGFELEMSTLRAQEPLPVGSFDTAHYRSIHHHLFQDVYSWAGRYRTVRTAKEGNVFCYPEYIADTMEALFRCLQVPPFMGRSDADAFITGAAAFLAELNAIHPFREGNGRAQLTFLFLVAERAGHPLALAELRPASFLRAMLASFHGILAPLIGELRFVLDPGQ